MAGTLNLYGGSITTDGVGINKLQVTATGTVNLFATATINWDGFATVYGTINWYGAAASAGSVLQLLGAGSLLNLQNSNFNTPIELVDGRILVSGGARMNGRLRNVMPGASIRDSGAGSAIDIWYLHGLFHNAGSFGALTGLIRNVTSTGRITNDGSWQAAITELSGTVQHNAFQWAGLISSVLPSGVLIITGGVFSFPFGNTGTTMAGNLTLLGGAFSAHIANTGTVSGSVTMRGGSFSGAIAQSGTISGVVSILGGTWSGSIAYDGSITGSLTFRCVWD